MLALERLSKLDRCEGALGFGGVQSVGGTCRNVGGRLWMSRLREA